MSRAFVKEDAQPAPEQWRKVSPMSSGARPALTVAGANRFRDELKRLKSGADPATASRSDIGERVAVLEDLLARADIVDVSELAGSQVKFGARVVLQDVDSDKRASYQIVGDMEAEPKLDLISVGSPLARALMGREVGDVVQVQTPGGEREYEIIDVLW